MTKRNIVFKRWWLTGTSDVYAVWGGQREDTTNELDTADKMQGSHVQSRGLMIYKERR